MENIRLIEDNETVPEFKVDKVFNIFDGSNHIGYTYINTLSDNTIFIEWIEFKPEYQGKGYFRNAFLCIMEYYKTSTLCFDSSEDNVEMYKHIGAIITGYDEFREMTLMELNKNQLERKNNGTS